jgi:prepilin-type N-terminal cleavage/methylation domain-containing protein
MIRKIRKHKAFTLIELLIVLVILGILTAALGPKFIAMINDTKITTALSNLDSIKKSTNSYNVAEIWAKEGLTDGTNTLQKFAGQLVLRKVDDDSVVKGTYVGDNALSISQNGIAFDQVLKNSYWLTPAEFTVDSQPTISSYWNGQYCVLADVDSSDVIKDQVLLYCLKTTKFQGISKYESDWSAVKASSDDPDWIDTLKSNAEDNGYNCVIAKIPFGN